MRLLKIMCLLLVGTCFGLKLSFIDKLTYEDPSEEQESEEPASQTQTQNTTLAQPEQQKAQEQTQEEKDSFADLLKEQDSLETSFRVDKNNHTVLVEKNKTSLANSTKSNITIDAKNSSTKGKDIKNNTAITLSVVKRMKEEQKKQVDSDKNNSKVIEKNKNNTTKATLNDFDPSELDKQLSKLQQAFNMPNVGQQMVENKKVQKPSSQVAAEVIAKTLKIAKQSQQQKPQESNQEKEIELQEQLPQQLMTTAVSLEAEAKIMDPDEYRLMHPFEDEQDLAERLNQWEQGDAEIYKLEQEKIKQVQQKELIYNKQKDMGSDSLLDPKNKDVLIIMAQKEKIDPKFKATKN